MMKRMLLGVLLVMGLMVPALAAGKDIQGQRPVMVVADSFRFIPGAWARYAVRDKAGNENYHLWIATLERVPRRGKPASWMEIEVTPENQPAVVTRMLVKETPQGPGDLLQVIVQMRGHAPFVVPEKYYADQTGEVGDFQPAHTLQRLERGSLTLRGREIPVWDVEARDAQGRPLSATVSEAVPPMGLVRAESEALSMQLDDWGEGARSRIDGTPMNFYLWLMWQLGGGLAR